MLSLFPPKENSKQNKKNTHTQTKKPSGADSKQKMRENWTAVCADTDYYNKTESLEECRWMVLVFVIIKKKTHKNHKIKKKKKRFFIWSSFSTALLLISRTLKETVAQVSGTRDSFTAG